MGANNLMCGGHERNKAASGRARNAVDSADGTHSRAVWHPIRDDSIFFMPSSIFVDSQNGDVYVSDGEGRRSTAASAA